MSLSRWSLWLRVLFAVLITGLLVTAPLPALEVPALQGRVNDYAGLLAPAVARQLAATLAQLERTDSTQIVVVTIPSLEGDSLEDFSIRLAEQWKIGRKQKDNGAILLVAAGDRKIRIEVGYGLEGRLTDLVAGRIIRDVMVPYFRAGDFNQGILAGVQAMIQTVRGEFTAPPRSSRRSRRFSDRGGGLFLFLFLILMIARLARVGTVLGMVAGALALPFVGNAFFGFGFPWLLALIPAGLVLGGVLGGLARLIGGGSPRSRSHHLGGFWGTGSGGGFSSGGGFGGFSGGGGGFGGGGASGGW